MNLSDRHSPTVAPIASGSRCAGGSLHMSAGTQRCPIDLSSGTPPVSIVKATSLASGYDFSVLSSESAHSTLNLSAYSSSFPAVPPVSDQMIEALSLGLERDYHEALILSDVSSNSSSASSSRSDLFDGYTATGSYLESGRTTPDTEWESPEHDSISLLESTPASLAPGSGSEGPTVRLVPSSGSTTVESLPSLTIWPLPPS